ncbi:MAG: hypothetical protein KAU95_03080 [Candidatus Aenigmarchaeota archaeon]|nr:hypothetical protein [Candidatus Aenigmarchaeota archaeon]
MVYDCGFIADPNLCRILYEMVFPWIFCFAMIFGLLIRSKIFGEDKTARGVSGIIGLIAGYLIIMTYGPAMGGFLATMTGGTVMFATVLMGIILVITMINPAFIEGFSKEHSLKAVGLIVALCVIAWLILGGSVGGMNWYSMYLTQDLAAFVIILIVVGIMAWFIGITDGGAPAAKTS